MPPKRELSLDKIRKYPTTLTELLAKVQGMTALGQMQHQIMDRLYDLCDVHGLRMCNDEHLITTIVPDCSKGATAAETTAEIADGVPGNKED